MLPFHGEALTFPHRNACHSRARAASAPPIDLPRPGPQGPGETWKAETWQRGDVPQAALARKATSLAEMAGRWQIESHSKSRNL